MALSLGTSLHAVGLSHAKGIDLVATREQLDTTLPRGEKNEGQATRKQVPAPRELTPEQQRQVADLRQIDRTVRAHEQAHLSAGRGVVTSGANFSYTYGPDGKQYAVAGEVSIDTSPEEKAEANIDKGRRIQIAALAPRDPSPQDYRVASVGGRLEQQGHTDLAREQAEERALTAERAAQARDQAQQARDAASVRAAPDDASEGDTAEGAMSQRVNQAYAAATGAATQPGVRLSLFA